MLTAQVLLNAKFRRQFLHLRTRLLMKQRAKLVKRGRPAHINLFDVRGKGIFKKDDRGQYSF